MYKVIRVFMRNINLKKVMIILVAMFIALHSAIRFVEYAYGYKTVDELILSLSVAVFVFPLILAGGLFLFYKIVKFTGIIDFWKRLLGIEGKN